MHRRFTAVFRWLFLIIILVGMFGQPRGTELANAASIHGGASSETRGSVYTKLKQAPASRTGVSASVQNSTSLPGSDVIVLPATNSASSNDIGLNNSSERRRLNAGLVGVEPYVTPSFATYSFNGGLTIEPITAYNLIVDSNVLSPSSYGPSAATLGAKFCNTNSTDLTNVWAYIGDFNADNDNTPGEAGDQTPGMYPIHNATTDASFNSTFPHLATPPTAVDYGDPSRFYALEHEAGSASDTADASRYIGTLAAGQCKTHYWLVSYPRKAMISGNWVDVTGGVKPEDDLWLAYYFWGTSGATSNNQSYIWNPVTMRNEISAMANKIWPNGDNKVPDQYITAIQQILGWDTWTPNGTGTTAYPGETVTSQGIWYDLGNVGAGFDNNLDFVPDRNLWVQPIGDADAYDPGCFRLVRSYGLVIVKLNDGTELLIPFVDQMYFENIPDNNNGAVGLVFYEYTALDGACTAGLTPYQEVASGYDNEKFNADFGAGIPPLQSRQSNMTLDKNGQASIGLGGTIDYTMTFTLPDVDATSGNTMTVTVGNPSLGMPLTFYETVPAGLQYLGGSASVNVIMTNYSSGSVPATRLWSIDSGATWSSTDPGNVTSTSPNNLVLIQWQLDQGIVSPANGPAVTGQVSFSAVVPGGYTSTVVTNTSCLKLGNAECFTEDTHTTLVTGTGRIEGTVWKDDATGSGVLGNGILDETGAGINAVTVTLYWDANGDGDYSDIGDFPYTMTTSDPSGNYAFTNLPATSGSARYLIEIDAVDGDLPSGYGPTTQTSYSKISLASGGIYGDGAGEPSDFGFAPALDVDKRLDTTGIIMVGDTIQYTIAVSNTLPGSGTNSAMCEYAVWSGSESTVGVPSTGSGNSAWQNVSYAFGRVDNRFSTTIMSNSTDIVGLSGFSMGQQAGNITSVKYVVYMKEVVEFGDDQFIVRVYYNNNSTPIRTDTYLDATLSSSLGTVYKLEQSITSPNGSWTWTDFQNNLVEMQIEGNRIGGSSGDAGLDAAEFIVTTDQPCGGSDSVLNPVPLTDTFNDTYFDFIYADPPVSSYLAGSGTLTWNNVGPLYPGQTRLITVSLRAAQAGTSPNTDNTATSTNSKFANGLPANTPESDTATVTIGANANTRTFDGTIFDDNGTSLVSTPNGWSGTAWSGGGTGMDAVDTGIQGVKVNLYGCYDNSTGALVAGTANSPCATAASGNDGVWRLVRTTYTASNGTYSFANLGQGYYYAQVDTSSIIGTQVADVNQTNVCTTCDSLSNVPATDNVNASFVGNLSTVTSVTRVNFGYNVTGSYNIGDLLFYDWDGDGVQDANDEPIFNATVRLLAADGTQIATTTTNASGIYGFNGYASAYYTVQVDTSTLPAGVVQSKDPDSTMDNQSRFALTDNDLTRDFAYQPTGSGAIGDTVWVDVNGDGSQSSSEAGIAGITVSLQVDRNGDGTYVTLATDVTDASGNYLFTDLPQGTYRAVIDRTANSSFIPNDAFGNDYLSSTGTTSGTLVYRTATLATSTSNDLSADFGFAPPASIGDTVYFDVNGNGTHDLTEDGINGVTVTLYTFSDADGDRRYDPGETLSAAVSSTTTTTDALTGKTGFYQFGGLTPGYYVVQVTPLAGMTLTGDPNTDGFACQVLHNPADAGEPSSVVCDHRDGMRLYNGTNYTGADFGYIQPGYVGDTVWIDADGDGVRDFDDANGNTIQDLGELFTEAGIPNITVTLTYCGADNNCATAGDNTTIPTETDADGVYAFTGLAANGTFRIDLNTADPDWPAGLTASSPSFEKNDTTPDTQTDFVTTGGSLSSINGLACTTCDLQVDFGYRYVGNTSIAGTVCLEVNSSDGQCDNINTSDVAFQGITIYLYLLDDTNKNGRYDAGETVTQVASMLTDGSGNFSFSNLPDGEKYYIVALAAPQDDLDLTTQEGADTPSETTDLTEVTNSGGDTVSASQVLHVAAGDTSVTEVDFAFESNTSFDYGDLPDTYATTLEGTPDGPRHTVAASPTLYLGTVAPDSESNGVPSAGAMSDDSTLDDEDGVSATGTWSNGNDGGTLQVVVTGTGYLTGWIDLNRDGDFDDGLDTNGDGDYSDPGEWREFIIGQNVTSQTYTIPVDVPAGTFGAGNVSLNTRFRLFSSQPPIPALAYSGAATNGEVEDNSFTWSMTVDKDTSTASVTANGTVSYTVALVNTGSVSLTNVQATDALPDFNGGTAGKGYTVTGVTATNGVSVNFPGFNGDTDTNLLASNATLASGSSTVITIQLTLSGAIAGTYDNTAGAFSTQTGSMDDDGQAAGDPGTPGVGADPETDEDVTVSVPVDLSLDKQVTSATPVVGSNVTFTLVVSNGGPSTATNIVITDVLPNGYTYVNASIAGGDSRNDAAPAGTGLTWTINSLASGTSANLTYQGTVLGTGTYDNYAEITAHSEPDSDSTPGNGQQVSDEDDDDTVTVSPVLTATISDFVWNDLDGDGVQDGGSEVGLIGVRVYIDQDGDDNYDVGEPTALTNASGIYSITDLAAGTYVVRVDTASAALTGYVQTYDLDGTGTSHEASVTVTAGQTRTDVDFGYQQSALIGNYVWNDHDADGVQDAGESGIDGVTVRLYTSAGVLRGTTTTAGGGAYAFADVTPGDYYVNFTLPSGYVFTTQDAAADATDSDADTGTGNSAVTTLSAGETDNTWDAGMYRPLDLRVTKSDGVTTYIPGGTLTYTIRVWNTGPNDAVNATFTDGRPTSISSWNWTCTAAGSASCGATTSGTGMILVNDIDLPADAGGTTDYLTFTITATVSGIATGSLTNDATVSTPSGFRDTNITNNTASDTDTLANTTLTLQKTVVNDNGGTAVDTDWTLTAAGPSTITGTDGQAAITSATVPAGIYTLSESGGPSGYTAGAWTCVGAADGDPANGLTLAAGETVTCTITNNDNAPSLTLNKIVVNDNGGSSSEADWTLTATGPTTLSGTGAAGSADVVSGAGFSAGTYTLSESGQVGYSASAWTCTNGVTVTSSQITLGLGQTTICSVTNNDNAPTTAALTLQKTVVNNNGGTATDTDWTLTATGPSTITGTEGQAAITNATVPAGTYTLSEAGVPTGYTAGSWSCTNGVTVTAGDITLANGQSTTCTITNNDDPPSLTLVKNVTNDNGGTALASAWTLIANGTGTNDLSGTGPSVSSGATLQADTFALSESGGPAGYTASTWSCTNGVTVTGGQITLSIGQSTTCTITNDDPPASIGNFVWNDLDGDGVQDGGLEVGLDGVRVYIDQDNDNTYDADEPTAITAGGGLYSISNLAAGTYAVRVDTPTLPGYVQSYDLDGTGTSHEATVTVAVGQNRDDVDFGYRQPGSLVIIKNSVPDNGQDFAYTVNGTGLTAFSLDDDADGTLSNTRTFNSLAAGGTYTATETAVTGWSVTNISCTGATSSTVTIGAAGSFNPGDTNVSVQLAAGETVTCTFDNTASLSIVTTKTANDTSIPETGQSVIYTVQVQNTSPVSVTLNSLTDNIFNNITTTGHDNVTAATCATGGTIAAGAAYSCTFTATVSGSFPGTHVNTVTAQVSNGSSTASHSDNETITFEDVLPAITVTKTANPTSVPETGGSVIFTYQVQNTGTVPVTITSLGDDKFTISGDADCQVGTVLAAGASCDFTATQTLSGAAGTTHTNIFTAQARDSQANAASHTDNAVVTFTDTLGSISGTVYDDRNGDGNFDLGEPGISGVTVTLYQDTDGNGSFETTVATHPTDLLTGTYSFGNLPAGTYRVVETDPTGYSSTGDTNGANDNQINITLGVGSDSATNDFFDWQPASIAGTVYNDTNADGNFDIGEPGLSAVTVTLYSDRDGDGSYETTVGTYTTDLTTGDYSFGNLPAGSYHVVETDPAGYVSTGDTNAANDNIINVTLVSGANPTDNDFFDIQQATVDGTVYLDVNGNGSYDVGTDTPFNGVDVFITDSLGVTHTVQTNASGYFSQVVPAGATGVNVDNADLPVGVALTTGSTDPTAVTVPAGGTGTDNTGYIIPADIYGTVYDDLNGGGNFDAGEPGLTGVTVELRNGVCTPGVDCPTTTTVSGDYSFTNLPPGSYTVVETDPAGYVSTGDADGANDNIIHVTLSNGVDSTDNDFFDTDYADISGTVHNDLNGDGNFDTGEPGLAGAQITLWKDTDNNGSYETQVGGSFTTLSGGAYSFTNLPAGLYQVREVDPSGYTSTGDTNGANDNIINITLLSGTNSSANNFFDAQPEITVTKSANPTSVPETGGTVNFTYQVQNTGTVPVTIKSLSDNIFGVLAGDADCQINTVLSANASCDFTINQTLSGAAGSTHTNVFTAQADDSSGNRATDDNDAVVTFTDVLPALTVTKTASPTNIPETGASVIFTYQVQNTGTVPVTITSLMDDKFTITGDADCQVGTVLAASASCNFTSTQTLSGIAGTTHTNIFTTHVRDADSNNATDTDDAVVAFDSIFDPPTAIKTFNAAGLPELEFRMVWINSSNLTAIGVQVTDAIPLGTAYVAGSITCEERGSSSQVDVAAVPVPVSPLITAAPEWSCGYDAVNNQVQWMGTIGPDNGNLTEAAAANEVVITFRVSVNASVNQVQNQGSARTDVDDDANFVEEMVLGTSLTSSNVVAWTRTSADPGQPVTATNTLPATGFAPNVVTDLSQVPHQTYTATDDVTVEIPSLNIKIPVVGVPKKDGMWNVSWLGNQAGWLEGSAFPSWSGNSVLTSHVYLSNGLPGPFISLGKLKYGDKILIHAYGQKYTFEVRTNEVVEPNDKSAMKHEEKAWLTLITCKEYDEKTNTYRKRIVVRAVLVNVTGE